MKIRGFNHVGVTVSNFEKAVNWYNKYFGFVLVCYEEMDESKIDKLQNLYKLKNTKVKFGFLRGKNGSVIEIFEFSNQIQGETALWNKTGITHLTLDVKNVPKYYEELKPQGVEFLCEPQYTSGTCW
ncbi:VOC family protein, partial [Romboutsia sp.]|uniref:VOC family protein n=1 Tax=Romboutsia sp. TaxID=1965302 RepID=UPI003F2A99DB